MRHFNLGFYFCTVDILPGTLSGERTHEYHYDVIIAISTITIAEQEPPQALSDEEFHFARTVRRELQVVDSNGDRPTIPVMIPGHEESKRARVPDRGRYRVGTAVLRDRKGVGRLELV
jgi:hypothetical protein